MNLLINLGAATLIGITCAALSILFLRYATPALQAMAETFALVMPALFVALLAAVMFICIASVAT
jgi:hypothetical protein